MCIRLSTASSTSQLLLSSLTPNGRCTGHSEQQGANKNTHLSSPVYPLGYSSRQNAAKHNNSREVKNSQHYQQKAAKP